MNALIDYFDAFYERPSHLMVYRKSLGAISSEPKKYVRMIDDMYADADADITDAVYYGEPVEDRTDDGAHSVFDIFKDDLMYFDIFKTVEFEEMHSMTHMKLNGDGNIQLDQFKYVLNEADEIDDIHVGDDNANVKDLVDVLIRIERFAIVENANFAWILFVPPEHRQEVEKHVALIILKAHN